MVVETESGDCMEYSAGTERARHSMGHLTTDHVLQEEETTEEVESAHLSYQHSVGHFLHKYGLLDLVRY